MELSTVECINIFKCRSGNLIEVEMQKILKLLFIFLGTAYYSFAQVFACEAVAPQMINMTIDLESGSEIFYDDKHIHTQRPSLSLEGCEVTARDNRYIMIGLAQENPILTNETTGFTLREVEEVYSCQINNVPEISETQPSSERYERLLRRRQFLNECLQIQVTDFSPAGIQYPEEQPNCTIEKVSAHSVNFTGAFCFFKPSQVSNFSVHPQIRKSCRNEETLKELFNTTVLEDFNLMLNTYIAGDSSGNSPDLTAKSVTQLRLSYNPLESLIPVSEDFGELIPRWPEQWNASNVHFGPLEIRTNNRNYDAIKLPFVVDNRCERTCEDSICTSNCDYAQPFAAEFTLYEVINGRKEFIRMWYDGAKIPAQYQGMVYGLGKEIPKNVFEPGKRYRIHARFLNPNLEYQFFAGRVARVIGLRTNHIGEMRGASRVRRIPFINTIADHEPIPRVPTISGLNFNYRPFGEFSGVLNAFRSHLHNAFWPPEISHICSTDSTRCEVVDRDIINLELDFTIESEARNRFLFSDMRASRSSLVDSLNYRDRYVAVQPELSCVIPGAGNFDDDDYDYSDF